MNVILLVILTRSVLIFINILPFCHHLFQILAQLIIIIIIIFFFSKSSILIYSTFSWFIRDFGIIQPYLFTLFFIKFKT